MQTIAIFEVNKNSYFIIGGGFFVAPQGSARLLTSFPLISDRSWEERKSGYCRDEPQNENYDSQ